MATTKEEYIELFNDCSILEEIKPTKKSPCLYIIENFADRIKIGVTSRIYSRMGELERASKNLRGVGGFYLFDIITPPKPYRMEKYLCNRFTKHSVNNGEWLYWNVELRDELDFFIECFLEWKKNKNLEEELLWNYMEEMEREDEKLFKRR
jgi:hypothetical protein